MSAVDIRTRKPVAPAQPPTVNGRPPPNALDAEAALIAMRMYETKNGIRVVERVVMDGEQEITFLPNLLGSLALVWLGSR